MITGPGLDSRTIALDNDKDLVPFVDDASRLWESHGADYSFKEVRICNGI